MQIKSDRIVFPDNTEQFTAGGGSGGGSTLESLGIPNHDRLSILGDGVTNTQVSFDNDAVTTSVSCGAVNDRFVIKNGHAERVAVATDGRVDISGSLYVNGSAISGGMTVALNYNETNTTMNHSKGVSSVTVESAGSLVINFSTPFPSNYYVWAGTARWNDGVNGNGMIGTSEGWVKDTSKIKIHVFDSARGSSTSKFSSSEVNFMATM